tara:strand:+ start:2559 stop:2759 length:201 start_codon:yes stop_codon:yes gene_type:complete
MINLLAAASLDLNEAWNMSWGEGIQFIIVLAFVYWLKVQIDTRAGLGKKKEKQLKRIIVEAIKEAG